MEIKKDNLEDALSGKENSVNEKRPEVSKEMEIGFHQGALNTLVNERNEMIRIIQQTEQVMQAHIKRLEELGVKINFGKEERKE